MNASAIPTRRTAPLENLASSDPVVAPLALALAEVFRAAKDQTWSECVPRLDAERLRAEQRRPVLHGLALTCDPEAIAKLIWLLSARLADATPPTASQAATRHHAPDPVGLVRAGLTEDVQFFEDCAARANGDAGTLHVLARLAAMPLLLASARQVERLVGTSGWTEAWCPVCAAWPLLAEVRGLERDLWLRCGRCASGWRTAHARCIFCGSTEARTLGYLASPTERESRRAATCDRCRRYLKTVATLGPLSAEDLLATDLATLELDVAALEREYAHPSGLARPLSLTVVPRGERA